MTRAPITLTFVVAGLTSGCALTETTAPLPAGPSELALSLAVAATPDVLVQDGISRAQVTVSASRHDRRPVPGLTLFVDVEGDDLAVDSGRLSHRQVATDGEGRAQLSYTARRVMPGTGAEMTTVTVVVRPIGDDAAGVARSARIRLVPPGAIP